MTDHRDRRGRVDDSQRSSSAMTSDAARMREKRLVDDPVRPFARLGSGVSVREKTLMRGGGARERFRGAICEDRR